ncbi:MAG: hypothetical protein QOJ20_1138 [Mycobacterium sp.]|jgi:hypothetical protein|nr:hypothetical protein [Mycobacterium sp.]
MSMIIFDVLTVGLVGCASVIAFRASQRGGSGLEYRLLLTVVALLGVAGVLQLAKLIKPPTPSITAAPTPSPSVTPTPKSKDPEHFFDAREPIPPGKYDSTDDAMIENVPHQYSRGVKFCPETTRTWQYDIHGNYSHFHAFVVLDHTGTSEQGAFVKFEAVADNHKPVAKTLKIRDGEHAEIDVELADIQNLKLTTSLQKQNVCDSLIARWADATVVPK